MEEDNNKQYEYLRNQINLVDSNLKLNNRIIQVTDSRFSFKFNILGVIIILFFAYFYHKSTI